MIKKKKKLKKPLEKTKVKKKSSSGGSKGGKLSKEKKAAQAKARKCITPKGRLSFPSLFETAVIDGEETGKYQGTILIPKNVSLKALKAAANNAAIQQWGTADVKKLPKGKKGVPFAWPFNDGDDKEDLEGYPDHIYIRASSNRRPQVVDIDRQPITAEDDNIKAGDYVRFSLSAGAYGGPGTKFNPGVTFYLQNVQKLADGEPFAGGSTADQDFDDDYNDDEE